MLQYAMKAGLIEFALDLIQIHDFAKGKSCAPLNHNRASSMLSVGVIQGFAAISPTLLYGFLRSKLLRKTSI